MAALKERLETPERSDTNRVGRVGRVGKVAGAASGAAFVVLILVGNSLVEEGGNPVLGVPLELLGFAALACFVAYVATTLRNARSGMPILALVGGVTMLAVKLASAAPYLAAEHADVSAEVAVGLTAINDAAFVISWLPHGLFIIGLAVAALQAARLPRAVSVIGVVIGLGCIAAAAVPAAEPFVVPFLLSLLWLIAVSALLVRGELRADRTWSVEI